MAGDGHGPLGRLWRHVGVGGVDVPDPAAAVGGRQLHRCLGADVEDDEDGVVEGRVGGGAAGGADLGAEELEVGVVPVLLAHGLTVGAAPEQILHPVAGTLVGVEEELLAQDRVGGAEGDHCAGEGEEVLVDGVPVDPADLVVLVVDVVIAVLRLAQLVPGEDRSYDEDSIANVGRGYWSFDTVGAVTWYKEDWGTEVSWAWGLMHNADSEYIEYHTSNESHVDLAINQRVFDGLKLGLRYYRLNQLHGDWGEDAVLGNLEGFSRGAGVGFEWAPTLANGTLHVSGTYLRGIEDRDGALDAERGMLSVSWTF